MNPPSLKDATERLVTTYGPFAFGIVSLLVIWYVIIQPELDRKQLDFETHKRLIDQQHVENQQQEETARAMRDTALILDRVTDRLESWALEAK